MSSSERKRERNEIETRKEKREKVKYMEKVKGKRKDAVKQNQNELLNKNNDKLHCTYFATMEKIFLLSK